MTQTQFFDIGYERATQAAVIDALKAAGVKTLVDVRDVANSRRAGFAKKALAAGLDEAGIAYIHLRALGTPKAGRQANRAGHMEDFWNIYEQAFEQPEAQLALQECAELCGKAPTALLCFCADGKKCHRHRIAQALEEAGLERVSLSPRLVEDI